MLDFRILFWICGQFFFIAPEASAEGACIFTEVGYYGSFVIGYYGSLVVGYYGSFVMGYYGYYMSLVYDPYEHVPISYGVGDVFWRC